MTFLPLLAIYGGTAQNLGPIVESRGFSPEVAGVLLSLLHVTQVGGTLFVGALSDRFATRGPFAVLALAAALGAALVGLGHNEAVLGAGVMLAGLGNAFWPLLGGGLAREFGAGAIGRAFGLAAFFVPVVSLVPFVVARVKEATGAYTLAFIGLAIVCACGGLVCAVFLKDKPLVRLTPDAYEA
jgi:MFS family permease